MSAAPPSGHKRIMIYRPKTDRTYVVEFRMADGDALAIASALRNDVGKGLASGFVSLPYRSVTELRECDLDVVGSATQRGVVIYIPGPDLVGQVNDDLHETLRARGSRASRHLHGIDA